MKIEELSEERIVVELSAGDMDDLEISFEELDYSNIETRRVIWTLLDRAGRELGRDIDPSGRMMIEVIPGRKGGCVLHFTLLGETKRIIPQRVAPCKKADQSSYICFEFSSIDSVLDSARAYVFFGSPLPRHSSLYEKDGKYRLLISYEIYSRSLHGFFEEYGQYVEGGKMLADATREYWREIAGKNALKKLAGG